MKTLIVDISHHQPSNKIDWEKASKEVALMIIRVQYGSTTIDKEYKNHVANCKKYKIPFAHYAYARFVSVEDAKVEAKDFINRIDKDALFLVADVEEQTTKVKTDMLPATQAFIDVCKAAGYKTGLYTGHHFYKPYSLDKVKSDFLWIPRYGTNDGKQQVKPDYKCEIWQYTSSGRTGWYNGVLDLNVLVGDKDLNWFLGIKQAPVQPKPISTPEDLYKSEKESALKWAKDKDISDLSDLDKPITMLRFIIILYRFYKLLGGK